MREKQFYHTLRWDALDSPFYEEQTHRIQTSRTGDPVFDRDHALLLTIPVYRHEKACPYYERLVKSKRESGEDKGDYGVYEGDDLSQKKQDCTCGVAQQSNKADI